MSHILEMPSKMYEGLQQHLLPDPYIAEEVAFVFARFEGGEESVSLSAIEWLPVAPSGFESRSAYHLELSDETRAQVIKRAHDLGASLVEFHSHGGSSAAAFSPSDLGGFEEFVPHVLWRLKARPYAAVVVARGSFDGFVWCNRPPETLRLSGIRIAERLLRATGQSSLTLSDYERYRTL